MGIHEGEAGAEGMVFSSWEVLTKCWTLLSIALTPTPMEHTGFVRGRGWEVPNIFFAELLEILE